MEDEFQIPDAYRSKSYTLRAMRAVYVKKEKKELPARVVALTESIKNKFRNKKKKP